MTKEEAIKQRPCAICAHLQRCVVVSFQYSPCANQTDENYHCGFVPAKYQDEGEKENE